MSHMDGNKKRTVIVSHPDFEIQGVAGIQNAKDFALTLIAGQKQMISMAEKSGEPIEKINQVRSYVEAFTIVIRSIDDRII